MTDADDDGWVDVAMTDTTLVVELLMQLLQNHELPSKTSAAVDLPHSWRVRQRRSKESPSSSTPTSEKVKAMESTRESPTTPLSWSGGGGSDVSGGCAEASCKPPLKRPTTSTSRATRSKFNTTSETTSAKRSKKKKTLPVLREEEKMLLRERKKLKHELASLRATVEKERTTNESLKRIKTAKGSAAAASFSSEETMSAQDQKLESICEPRHTNSPPCLDCNLQSRKASSDRKRSPLLPDLNLPLEEEFFQEGLHTVS